MTLLLHHGEFEVEGGGLFGGESDFLNLGRDFLLESRIKIVGVDGRFGSEDAVGPGGKSRNLVATVRTNSECNRLATAVGNKHNHRGHRHTSRRDDTAESSRVVTKYDIDRR